MRDGLQIILNEKEKKRMARKTKKTESLEEEVKTTLSEESTEVLEAVEKAVDEIGDVFSPEDDKTFSEEVSEAVEAINDVVSEVSDVAEKVQSSFEEWWENFNIAKLVGERSPNRIFLMAQKAAGKPVDVIGEVVDRHDTVKSNCERIFNAGVDK